MYCPKAGEEISPQDCAKWQDDNCADCEYFEPFIWFMMEQEQGGKGANG